VVQPSGRKPHQNSFAPPVSFTVSPIADDRAAIAPARSPRSKLWQVVPLAIVLAFTAVALATGWYRELSLETLVRYRMGLERYVAAHEVLAVLAFVAIYVAVVTLSIPGAVYLTITGGLLFGTVCGALSSFASALIGATLLFLLARTAFGDHLMRRAGPRARRLAEGFRDDAFSYLLFLRLVPAFPFFVVNLVPALVGVRLMPFVAATAIGIIPATVAFTLVGSGLDSVITVQASGFRACVETGRTDCQLAFDLNSVLTPTLIAALVGLGALALIPVMVKRWRCRRVAGAAD
jgi:uncharacterized membrane protein YdjX (TVP38/TMEM64 family)